MEQSSPFWSLPRELRDEIYAYAFTSDRNNDQMIRRTKDVTKSGRDERLAIEPLLTSKAFFEEAAPYFGRMYTFAVRNGAKLQAFLCNWTGPKVDYGQYITSITLRHLENLLKDTLTQPISEGLLEPGSAQRLD
ncbi:hypothetical protein LTR85_010884 [Meristemomyces frigidus]|nr:hypothetical protein LTR85_010884 [Meristemomyces frigidus]